MNRVVLIGRLTRDPEARATSTGKSVASFSIAVNKRFKPKEGEGPDADFFRGTAWGATADFLTTYLSKGRLIGVEGRIEQRSWTDKDGNKRESVEVVADNIEALDRAPDSGEGGGGGKRRSKPAPAGPTPDDYDPFAEED